MNVFFERITGNNPYSYQIDILTKCLVNKENLFISAPTGSGKTWAALFPFLWAKKQGIDFVDRLIYVLPLRTLATTLYNETVNCCHNAYNVKTLPENRTKEKDEIVITIQTGEQKDDPFFEGDIIFTTVDQCLSSYINMPVSLPKRVGNINAGALLGSIVVFDEFHLLQPAKAMGTALEMLDRIKPFSRFIIMTATLANKSLELLKLILGGEIKQLTTNEILSLPSHKEKKRTYRWVNNPIDIDNIVQHHAKNRTIVIVNTVKKAQDLFEKLEKILKKTETKIFLLHSRFYQEDRKGTEEKLNDWFGKKAKYTNVILVTTQVVEAGIDISADNLHTELAPFNSIVQRAGRCARYEGERGVGTIWIYDLEKDKKNKLKLAPYNDLEQLIITTKEILKSFPSDGKIINYTDELEIVDKVHTEMETAQIKSYQNLNTRRNQVHNAMDGINPVAVRELIRDASSINVIIYNNPNALMFNKKHWPRMISVPRSSLYTLSPFFEGAEDKVAWYPVENNTFIDDESDISFGWEPIVDEECFNKLSWLIVINPDFASYSSSIGLQIGKPSINKEPEYFDKPLIPRYKIHFETYPKHIQNVINECRKMHCFYNNASIRLSKHYKITREFLDKLVETACSLHDAGKLSIKWQESVIRWQKYKNSSKLTGTPLAHSDYDPEKDFEEKRHVMKQLPNHAAEGAYAVGHSLMNHFNEAFGITILTAITRHHGAFTKQLNDFRLINGAKKWINDSINCANDIISEDNPKNIARKQFPDDLLHFSKYDNELWPLYAFIVRRLRLADQKSQKEKINE